MSDLTVTAAKFGLVNADDAEVIPVTLAAAVVAGQVGYQVAATGLFGLADADADANHEQLRGMYLQKGAAGQTVDLLIKGDVFGFDLSGLAYDAPVFLSVTPGAMADATGGIGVNAGRVRGMNDPAKTKVLHFQADWLRTWA